MIPVVDPAIGHLIGYKERSRVHSDGDFHVGIQAYIVRINEEGQTEVLVQKRSGVVDIAKGQFDQSLATQILAKDGGALKAALIRGLKEELDIDEDEIEVAPLGLHAELKVYKKYADDPNLYNWEFIYLNFVWEKGEMRRIDRQVDFRSKKCLQKMVTQIEKDIARLEEEAKSDEDRKLTWTLRRKFNYIFNTLRSRILSGEMIFFECLPADEKGDFGINNYPDNITIITIPGTFDPPHFAHIELMFDAMIHESEQAHGKRTAYALFFTPVGDYAPGPSGQTWKTQKTESKIRHEMCEKVSEKFYPLMA